jgi:3-oxoacyl-[acyl-carrier-protein] synthase-1
MRRVVVSGLGIVSSIGNNANEVQASLHDARSGISFSDSFAEHGFRCQVWGAPTLDPAALIDRRAMRFLSQGAAWNHVAMDQAIVDAGLGENDITNERTGIVMGSGGPSTRTIVEAAETTLKNGSPKRIGPFAVPKAMSSTASATLATWFKIHGVNYSISSACSTSAHCIGNGYELIQWGKQDMVFAGGHEDLDWTMSDLFDAMGAMSSKFNDRASAASLATVSSPVDYINTHGTSTPVGDSREMGAIREVFGENMPFITSTKSLTGHSLGAAGVQESIYSILMMQGGFIGESAHIEQLDPEFEGMPIVRERIDDARIDTVLSNSFGFGGTNATLIFQRYSA